MPETCAPNEDADALKTCLPLLAEFCLQQEKDSTASCRAASNWTMKKNASHKEMLSPLSGETPEESMNAQKMAFLQTVIHNNLIGGNVDKKPEENTVPAVIWNPAPMDAQWPPCKHV